MEIWKSVVGYEGYYKVSTYGRVKSLKRKGRQDDKILVQVLNHNGYPQVRLCKNGNCILLKVHRLVAKAFILNSENKSEVNHKDGIKAHNEDYNIEWCTSKENMKHADMILGINTRGESNGKAKLTKADVLRIRESDLKHRELAKIFRVSRQYIDRIKYNRTWRHL